MATSSDKKKYVAVREFVDRKKLAQAQKLLVAFDIENKIEYIKRNGVTYGFNLLVISDRAAEADKMIEK